MQKLEERNTYTPTNVPQVRGNCGLSLNVEETLSMADLKTSSNNSDAALTATKKGHAGQDLRVPATYAVYVLNMRGKPLMPTTGIECFIFGRRKTGYFDLRKLDGTKIHASAKAKELVLIETASTLLIERTNIKEVNREGGANSSPPFRVRSPLLLRP